MSDIFLDPNLTDANVIKVGGVCYVRVGEDDRQAQANTIGGEFNDCNACADDSSSSEGASTYAGPDCPPNGECQDTITVEIIAADRANSANIDYDDDGDGVYEPEDGDTYWPFPYPELLGRTFTLTRVPRPEGYDNGSGALWHLTHASAPGDPSGPNVTFDLSCSYPSFNPHPQVGWGFRISIGHAPGFTDGISTAGPLYSGIGPGTHEGIGIQGPEGECPAVGWEFGIGGGAGFIEADRVRIVG